MRYVDDPRGVRGGRRHFHVKQFDGIGPVGALELDKTGMEHAARQPVELVGRVEIYHDGELRLSGENRGQDLSLVTFEDVVKCLVQNSELGYVLGR